MALIGATSCFIYFFQACKKENIVFSLPPGPRICDGGGYVGEFGDWAKESPPWTRTLVVDHETL
ncbi:MAG: hypothetical protein OEY01_14160 [Desulfobulbaceae bacterium]|nr:hypothetical protein [Desulfobulbaceae bacterium]